MNKKTVVITGGNAGIGFSTAKAIAAKGHTVVLCCRNENKANVAISEIKQAYPQANAVYQELDLSSLNNVRKNAEKLLTDYPEIDVLINNAGIYPSEQQFTEDGFEIQIGVNYLGHFLLTHLLLPALQKTESARIVHLSSLMHNLGRIDPSTFWGRKSYSGTFAYAQSKLANLMFSNELAKRLPENITSNAVHPGAVDSEIYRDKPEWVYRMLKVFLIKPEQSGDYLADMAISLDWHNRTGEFKSAHGPLPVSSKSKNDIASNALYEMSCSLTGIQPLKRFV